MELSLNESTGDEVTIFELEVHIPSLELRFVLPRIESIQLLSDFLSESYNKKMFSDIKISANDQVQFTKDDEYSDRFFLKAEGEVSCIVSIVDQITSDLVRSAADLANQVSAKQ